jgi:hypothetical protein
MTGQRQAGVSNPEKVQMAQNGRQGQGREGSIIQRGGSRYRMAGRLRAGRRIKTRKY